MSGVSDFLVLEEFILNLLPFYHLCRGLFLTQSFIHNRPSSPVSSYCTYCWGDQLVLVCPGLSVSQNREPVFWQPPSSWADWHGWPPCILPFPTASSHIFCCMSVHCPQWNVEAQASIWVKCVWTWSLCSVSGWMFHSPFNPLWKNAEESSDVSSTLPCGNGVVNCSWGFSVLNFFQQFHKIKFVFLSSRFQFVIVFAWLST